MDVPEEIDIIKTTQNQNAQKMKELAAAVSYGVTSALGSHGELQSGSLRLGFGVRAWGKGGGPGAFCAAEEPPC